ncbi:hypothetical protein XENTR_v10004434 [Xenopus tropicalis]|uniref:Uncharacterized protein LOC105945210 n=1 Tax=Xenopus tropicalis TaxID=8364 RepID=A0A8J0S9J9_XENTR|nr:uncharacterized protein LOC105945210 [Xenopus tropicalis]KAE8577100.1 hypothetical protein XENTR_v10004434 [Xenopus tropicalis]
MRHAAVILWLVIKPFLPFSESHSPLRRREARLLSFSLSLPSMFGTSSTEHSLYLQQLQVPEPPLHIMPPSIPRVLLAALLLSALSWASGGKGIEQTPYNVIVKRGAPVTIHCTAQDGVNLTEVSDINHQNRLLNLTQRGFSFDEQKIDVSGTCNKFQINIKNAQDDNIMYYCWGVMMKDGRKVDVRGGGTQINFSPEGSSASHGILIEIIVAALCVLYCLKTLGSCT